MAVEDGTRAGQPASGSPELSFGGAYDGWLRSSSTPGAPGIAGALPSPSAGGCGAPDGPPAAPGGGEELGPLGGAQLAGSDEEAPLEAGGAGAAGGGAQSAEPGGDEEV